MRHPSSLSAAPQPRTRALLTSLAGAAALAALAVPSPASAGQLLSVTPVSKVIEPGANVELTGIAGDAPDGYTYHSASVWVLRPGVACPAGPPAEDALGILGHETDWTIGGPGDQPDTLSVLLTTPSPVGTARVCTYVRPSALGVLGDPVVPGPQAQVRIKADLTAWRQVVGVISAELHQRGGRVPVLVGCSLRANCSGSLRIRRGRTVLGAASFHVADGETRTIPVTLTKRARALVARRSSLRVTADVRPAAGITLKRTLVLRRR